MKTTTILVFSVFLISLSVKGQPDKFIQKSGNTGIDTAILHNYFDRKIDTAFYKIPEKRDFSKGKNRERYFDLTPENKYEAPIRFKNYPGFIIAEDIPQSNGFTDNMPIIIPDTGGKLHMIKPDTIMKGYLKIKNPYSGIITK